MIGLRRSIHSGECPREDPSSGLLHVSRALPERRWTQNTATPPACRREALLVEAREAMLYASKHANARSSGYTLGRFPANPASPRQPVSKGKPAASWPWSGQSTDVRAGDASTSLTRGGCTGAKVRDGRQAALRGTGPICDELTRSQMRGSPSTRTLTLPALNLPIRRRDKGMELSSDTRDQWWIVPSRGRSRCEDCGNEVGKDGWLAFHPNTGMAFCKACAEHEGLDPVPSKRWTKVAQRRMERGDGRD